MIPLRPFEASAYKCPRCKSPLSNARVVISGMRSVIDAVCHVCNGLFYIDLPSGHALYYPSSVDRRSGELFSIEGVEWFSSLLVRGAANPRSEPVSISFCRDHRHNRIVLVNCLDFLYGHCLLKLLNVQAYLDKYPDLAVCVMIPKMFAHLVPEGVAETWVVDLPLKTLMHWYASIASQVQAEIEQREICYLSVAHSHPQASTYDLARFTKVAAPMQRGAHEPTRITFIYREDRCWGGSLHTQRMNLAALHAALASSIPSLEFGVVGLGKGCSLAAGIMDWRAAHPSPEREREWLRIYSVSDCVVGVHGSNMLLPSGMARNVVEACSLKIDLETSPKTSSGPRQRSPATMPCIEFSLWWDGTT